MKKALAMVVVFLLFASIAGNLLQFYLYNANNKRESIVFTNANSRDTYFTIHNVSEAHEVSKGRGVKVGIIDWNFGYDEYKNLYTEVVDFTGYNKNLIDGHGRGMAAVLKEIAPECEVYALAVGREPGDGISAVADAVVEAINWSIDNEIDILTLSLQGFSGEDRVKLDSAVDRAIVKGIVTTFIHYDNPNNILPFGLQDYDEDFISYARKPDINVFQYDYNSLFINQYYNYLDSDIPNTYEDLRNVSYIPFVSFSSMSPVTAGFVAILKSINATLTPDEYKKILVETSYSMHYYSVMEYEDTDAEHVVDIGSAVKYLQDNYE